jgi:uncharacterized membrane protein
LAAGTGRYQNDWKQGEIFASSTLWEKVDITVKEEKKNRDLQKKGKKRRLPSLLYRTKIKMKEEEKGETIIKTTPFTLLFKHIWSIASNKG